MVLLDGSTRQFNCCVWLMDVSCVSIFIGVEVGQGTVQGARESRLKHSRAAPALKSPTELSQCR